MLKAEAVWGGFGGGFVMILNHNIFKHSGVFYRLFESPQCQGYPSTVSIGSPKKWEGIWVNNLGGMNPCGQELCKKTFQLNISVHYIEDVAAKKKRECH